MDNTDKISLFDSIFEQKSSSGWLFFLCIVISLLIGFIYFLAYKIKNRTSKSMEFSLILLPAIVCVLIIVVNGNIGVGVAVAGAFSLVRFRSAPGSSKEICLIFMGMTSGVIVGSGYLLYAIIFTVIMSIIIIIFNLLVTNSKKERKILKITLPEDLNYEDIFKDILTKYTNYCNVIRVKTSDLGSLFHITYEIEMKKNLKQKDLIDELRIVNGNLEIMISQPVTKDNEL